MFTHLAVCACCDQLALVGMIDHSQEECVGKQTLPPPARIQIPDDAAAVTAGADTFTICGALDHNAVDWTLVVLHAGLHALRLLA